MKNLLRREAQERLSTQRVKRVDTGADDARWQAPESPDRLLHELQVRQLELEIQNDELLVANVQLEATKAEVQHGLERYTALYELAPLAYFTLNRDGVILRTNVLGSALAPHAGKRPGERFNSLLADESLACFDAFLQMLFTSEQRASCEVRMRLFQDQPSQSGPSVEMSRFVELTGQVERATQTCNLAVVDITGRHQARQEIERLNRALELRVQQLAESNRELEAFASSVAHDLQTPLTAIDGFRSLLERAVAEGNDAVVAHCADRIHACVEQMGRLTAGLLSLSRAAGTELHWEEVDLSQCAMELLRTHQETEPKRQVTVHVEPGVMARGDPLLLRQVLTNLLANAWKFTARHEAAEIWFGQEQDAAGNRSFFVKDNGAGFDMLHATRLFGPFERLHSHGEFPGTGIGLATVKRIIVRHGGGISAAAEPGRGATFRFTLG
jgi:signal transduction histidine kinase